MFKKEKTKEQYFTTINFQFSSKRRLHPNNCFFNRRFAEMACQSLTPWKKLIEMIECICDRGRIIFHFGKSYSTLSSIPRQFANNAGQSFNHLYDFFDTVKH